MKKKSEVKKSIIGIMLLSLVGSTVTGCGNFSLTAGSVSANTAVNTAEASVSYSIEKIESMKLRDTSVSIDYTYLDDATNPSVRYFLDKTAPTVSLNNVYLSMGDTCTIDSFIFDINDATPVSVNYVTEPDFSLYGKQDVTITVTDSNNNTAEAVTTLTILPVKSEYVMELSVSHNTPDADVFLMESGYDIAYSEPLPAPEDLTIGSFDVYLTVDGYDTTSVLTYIDTTSPSANAVDVRTRYGATFTADQLVKDIVDATQVTASFAKEPDWTIEGEQTVDVVLTDEGGNTLHVYPVVNLIIDTSAPVIQAHSTNVIVGKTLSYTSCITVTDNLDAASDIKLTIDASAVDLNTIGSYEVYITATDLSGNSSDAILQINVIEEPVVVVPVINQDSANALAANILATIITDGMTADQKAYAIWHWARYSIGYTHDFTIDYYASGAYRAISNRRSNCFGYASVIKTMCDLVGLPNFVICDAQRPHYWNAIDTGAGYYHYDATPRIDGTNICKWDDASLAAYSSTHGGTHKFDRAQYPAIN